MTAHKPAHGQRMTPPKSRLRFGFDEAGGFIALNDLDRRAAYAYPTSFFAERAAKSDDLAVRTANELLAALSEGEAGYIRLSGALVAAQAMPRDGTK